MIGLHEFNAASQQPACVVDFLDRQSGRGEVIGRALGSGAGKAEQQSDLHGGLAGLGIRDGCAEHEAGGKRHP